MIAKEPMRLKAEARTKQNYPIIQMLKKNGEWGVACATVRYGKETDEQVLERLHNLNPGSMFRIVGQSIQARDGQKLWQTCCCPVGRLPYISAAQGNVAQHRGVSKRKPLCRFRPLFSGFAPLHSTTNHGSPAAYWF